GLTGFSLCQLRPGLKPDMSRSFHERHITNRSGTAPASIEDHERADRGAAVSRGDGRVEPGLAVGTAGHADDDLVLDVARQAAVLRHGYFNSTAGGLTVVSDHVEPRVDQHQ